MVANCENKLVAIRVGGICGSDIHSFESSRLILPTVGVYTVSTVPYLAMTLLRYDLNSFKFEINVKNITFNLHVPVLFMITISDRTITLNSLLYAFDIDTLKYFQPVSMDFRHNEFRNKEPLERSQSSTDTRIERYYVYSSIHLLLRGI